MAFIKKFVKPFAVSASKDIMRDTIMDDAVAGGLISCAYPLDATAGEVSGYGALPFALTNGSQTCKFTLVGAPGAERKALALPTGFGAGTSIEVDCTVGRKVLEWLTNLPASVGGGAASAAYITNFFLSTSTPVVEVNFYRNADGTNTTLLKINTVAVYSSSIASIPVMVSMILDATTSTVEIRFDDTPITLSANTYTPAQLLAGMWAYEKVACPAGDAGKEIGGTLVTDAASMTGVYTAGETDICGNVI